MIIIGYQGIGKSTIAKKSNEYIDLQSGSFWYLHQRPSNWYIYYCQVAEHLSKQGYVVFVSSHKEVREFLRNNSKETIRVIFPSILKRDEWIKKLKDRYEITKEEKDYKAWMNAEDRYHENISELMTCGIPFIEIEDPDHYDLEELVLRMKGATAA